jgi:hypothetical protein
MHHDTRQIAFPALIAGVLMLVIGFEFERIGASDSDFYNSSVEAFNWIMRIGGGAMLLVAALGWIRWSGAFVADAVGSGLIGVALGIEALIWLSKSDIGNGILVLVFSLMFLNSARHSWLASRAPVLQGGFPVSKSVDPDQKRDDEQQ